ncbi:MAG: zinc ribbon domain-containing protein [Solirubrobacterales bacterium]
MAPVYCGTCGTSLNETAKFCRACGTAQAITEALQPPPAAPQPAQPLPPPQPGPVAFTPLAVQPLSTTGIVAAVMAIVGGAALCFVVLYGTVYQPLDHELSFNYGEPVRFVDILALASGLAAIAIGTLVLRRRPGSATTRGIWLVAAGAPTLILALIWSFPEAFNLSIYPVPFYFGYVYFADIGIVEAGDMYLRVPLVIACGMVTAAGFLITIPFAPRTVPYAGAR